MNHAEIVGVMRRVAKATGDMLAAVQYDARKQEVRRHDFVTAQDYASEEMILGQLGEFFPKIPAYSEESGGEERMEGLLFVIDPIDGTVNYFYRDDFWGVSIGLMKDGVPLLGTIYLPASKILFSTTSDLRGALATRYERGAAATVKLGVTKEANLAEARVWIDPVKGDPHVFYRCRAILDEYTTLPQTRVSAIASMMQIILGKIDGYVHPRPMPEDIAAAIPIVERAGGKVTNLKGNPFDIFSREVMVATNGRIHDELLKVLRA